ncbi:MAG: ADP-glyceromanno-heptose 6-epimerase, partial [Tepidisphaeraceae bacterium]
MRILVTGGAGFIGSNLALQLASDGHDVVVVDDFSSAHWSNLIGFRGDVVTLDVSSPLSPLARLDPCQVIFHQASITDTTVTDQGKMMSNNVEGFRNVLNLAGDWHSRVIWAGSASVYGRGQAPMKESASPQPLNAYAYSKLAMEHLADLYRGKLKHPIIGLRYFNVYGPGEDHKGRFASMIHQLAKQMRGGKRPRIFTAGQQRRDFVYVGDVVQANLRAMKGNRGGMFNVGSGKSWSFNEVVAELNRVLKTNLEPDYFENPYSFTQDWTEADITESHRSFGYEPKYDLARGIDAYCASG